MRRRTKPWPAAAVLAVADEFDKGSTAFDTDVLRPRLDVRVHCVTRRHRLVDAILAHKHLEEGEADTRVLYQ